MPTWLGAQAKFGRRAGGQAARVEATALRLFEQLAKAWSLDDDDRLHGHVLNGLSIYSPADLPGLVTAQVTQNVYDSPTGRILLIPQGSRLIGDYDKIDENCCIAGNVIAPGDSKTLGTVLGAVGGAVAGRAIERSGNDDVRCR